MANYNTNQARHMYVAKSYGADVAAVESGANGIITVATNTVPAGTVNNADHPLSSVYFIYKNADGIITRSDAIPVGNIEYVTKKAAADMDYKLLQHTITLDSAVNIADLQGKNVTVNIAVRGIVDDDPANLIPVTATVKLGASASASDLYKELAMAIVKAIPTFRMKTPFFKVFVGSTEITKATTSIAGTATSIILVATPGAWRRGLLSNKPHELTVGFATNADIDGAWGKDTVAFSTVANNTVIPSAYELADLEYFCLGERGDEFRGAHWPYNYDTKYMIDPSDTSTTYDLLTIQYFWKGHHENVQKSSRTIHIAAPAAVLTSLYSAFKTAAGLTESE